MKRGASVCSSPKRPAAPSTFQPVCSGWHTGAKPVPTAIRTPRKSTTSSAAPGGWSWTARSFGYPKAKPSTFRSASSTSLLTTAKKTFVISTPAPRPSGAQAGGAKLDEDTVVCPEADCRPLDKAHCAKRRTNTSGKAVGDGDGCLIMECGCEEVLRA